MSAIVIDCWRHGVPLELVTANASTNAIVRFQVKPCKECIADARYEGAKAIAQPELIVKPEDKR